jgi:putative flippase GtrA
VATSDLPAEREHLPIALRTKLARYSAASVAGFVTGQATLILCHGGLGWSGVASNLAAVTLGSVPNYLINRYWTWNRRGRNRLLTEVLPFWGFALAGLILSTWFVAMADDRWGSTLAVSLAQIAAFGSLWLVRFVFLDRLIFRSTHHHSY